MKRNILFLTLLLTACLTSVQAKTFLFNYGAEMAGKNVGLIVSSASSDDISDAMKIRVSDGTYDTTFYLNETSAAKSLYEMLPLEVKVENYSNNEKIFYPPTTVSYGDDCIEGDCPAGTLALFSPWGNVVMYYAAASRYSGLYILGQAVEGADNIQNLSGTIRVEAVGRISGIQAMEADNANHALRGYAPNGMIAAEGQKGVVIKDGKKILVK